MTVARLRVEMTSQEFTEWMAFDEFEADLLAQHQKHPPDSRNDESED